MCIRDSDTGIPSLRVVLSWNEVENSPSAGTQLRNDLDIFLKSPTGAMQTYANDDVNNLVGISIDSPDAGDWEVIVTGVNVVDGSQKYYLAASDGVLTDMRHPVSDGYNEPGFQSGSIFTETTMTAGDDHLCAILDDSSLQCWGSNEFGQMGDGTTTDRMTMTEVSLDSARTATSISSGSDHTCSILDNGELQCRGRNNYNEGQIKLEEEIISVIFRHSKSDYFLPRPHFTQQSAWSPILCRQPRLLQVSRRREEGAAPAPAPAPAPPNIPHV